MVTFAVIFRGRNVADAEAIAVSNDQSVVADCARAMLAEGGLTGDPILATKREGERKALDLIAKNPDHTAVL